MDVCTCVIKDQKSVSFMEHQPRTDSQLMKEHIESKEWLELATEIVQFSEAADKNNKTQEVTIPISILTHHQGLLNLQLDKKKVTQIKQALFEYQKLKKFEEAHLKHIEIREKSDKEYEKKRRRQENAKFYQNDFRRKLETAQPMISLQDKSLQPLSPQHTGLHPILLTSEEEDSAGSPHVN